MQLRSKLYIQPLIRPKTPLSLPHSKNLIAGGWRILPHPNRIGLNHDRCDWKPTSAACLKDGQYSRLINAISPGSVKKINTMKAPFKQRENIEMYLKACAAYGLKEQDLFQVGNLIPLQSENFTFLARWTICTRTRTFTWSLTTFTTSVAWWA